MTASKSSVSAKVDASLDPVVEEVRRRGRDLTQRLNNDPKRIFDQLYRLAEKQPQKMVSQLKVVAMSQEETS